MLEIQDFLKFILYISVFTSWIIDTVVTNCKVLKYRYNIIMKLLITY